MVLRFHFNQGFILRLILICGLVTQCRMADLNNPSDALSDEFAKRSILSEFVRYLLREKALPEALAVVLVKSSVPYETGLRVYKVDTESGVQDEYVSDVRTANYAAFPGCAPYRIGVPPRSRDIITFTGSLSDRVVVHRYSSERTLALLQDQAGIGSPKIMGFSEDGKTMYQTNIVSNPNTINRWSRDSDSGVLTPNNVGSYPFAVGCSPLAIKVSEIDNLIVTINSTLVPFGINVLKKTGLDSVSLVGGAPVTLPINPSFHENLCLIESKRLLYSTSINTTTPIFGYRYDSAGNVTLLPGSPFSADSAMTAHAPNFTGTTSLSIDPTGTYAAFIYAIGSTHNIRLLTIDDATGNLIQTDQKFTVGNGPKSLQWDRSGKFIYLISDSFGTTNNHQIEYFKLSGGILTRGENSPIVISSMTNGYAPQDIKPIQKYYY
ncbi:hypothetical protein ACO2KH_14860 [Leptospira terpstrae]|uniref:hypothetical protein n=1 Tax=Leptospira terpstrae TaxID=293075 RepID=UPI003D04EEC9